MGAEQNPVCIVISKYAISISWSRCCSLQRYLSCLTVQGSFFTFFPNWVIMPIPHPQTIPVPTVPYSWPKGEESTDKHVSASICVTSSFFSPNSAWGVSPAGQNACRGTMHAAIPPSSTTQWTLNTWPNPQEALLQWQRSPSLPGFPFHEQGK